MQYRSLAALVTLLCVSINTATAKSQTSHRVVDVIVMGLNTEHLASEGNEVDQGGSPDPKNFRVYDLNRRQVSRDTNSFMVEPHAALERKELVESEPHRVARTSSISVPFWMLSEYSPSPDLKRTCARTPYQSSGFLRPEAEARRADFYGLMSAIACEQGIPPGLFDAVIIQESRYDPIALSPRKAFGLAQLMPGTADQLGVNLRDPVQNLRGGARYLRQQIDRFGHVHLALAAYNAGPGRVRGGMVPQIAETQHYVKTILRNWSRLAVSLDGRTVPQVPPRTLSERSVGVYAF